MSSWRSQAVVERTGIAFLIVGAATLLPAFAIAVSIDSSHRERMKWSSTGTPDTYPGGPVDLFGVATTVFTVAVAIMGAALLRRHLRRRGASSRVALLAATVLLVLVLLADLGLIVASLRSTP